MHTKPLRCKALDELNEVDAAAIVSFEQRFSVSITPFVQILNVAAQDKPETLPERFSFRYDAQRQTVECLYYLCDSETWKGGPVFALGTIGDVFINRSSRCEAIFFRTLAPLAEHTKEKWKLWVHDSHIPVMGHPFLASHFLVFGLAGLYWTHSNDIERRRQRWVAAARNNVRYENLFQPEIVGFLKKILDAPSSGSQPQFSENPRRESTSVRAAGEARTFTIPIGDTAVTVVRPPVADTSTRFYTQKDFPDFTKKTQPVQRKQDAPAVLSCSDTPLSSGSRALIPSSNVEAPKRQGPHASALCPPTGIQQRVNLSLDHQPSANDVYAAVRTTDPRLRKRSVLQIDARPDVNQQHIQISPRRSEKRMKTSNPMTPVPPVPPEVRAQDMPTRDSTEPIRPVQATAVLASHQPSTNQTTWNAAIVTENLMHDDLSIMLRVHGELFKFDAQQLAQESRLCQAVLYRRENVQRPHTSRDNDYSSLIVRSIRNEVISGCPVYDISEVALEDFKILSRVLKRGYEFMVNPPEFPVLAALLRTAHTLSFDRITNIATHFLQRLWPNDPSRVTSTRRPYAIETVLLAESCNIRRPMKHAYYEVLRTETFGVGEKSAENDDLYFPASIREKTPSLTTDQLARLIKAREYLLGKWSSFMHSAPEVLMQCAQDRSELLQTENVQARTELERCRLARTRTIGFWRNLTAGIDDVGLYDILGGLDSLKGLCTKQGGLCRGCAQVVGSHWDEVKLDVWKDLDMWLQLE